MAATESNIGALIITGGGTGRAKTWDPLQRIGDVSVVQRLCMTFHLAGVRTVGVVVNPDNRAALEKHLARMPVLFIISDEEEMFGNIRTGVAHMTGHCERIFVTPVDVPLFSVETVRSLLACDRPMAVPVCEGHRGHPLLLHWDVMPTLLAYTGDGGLAGAIRQLGYEPFPVEVEDPGVYVKSDQFEACEKIAVTHSLRQWRPVMRLQIANESIFFGPGSWQLLSLIESTGSVRMASQQMGISYSKAWKVLNHLEAQVGYPVLDRRQGGQGGGETRLTDRGRRLMEWFELLESKCNKAVGKIFAQYPAPD